MTKPTHPTPFRYQDFVIKEGKFIGDFEGLYRNFEDPWNQSEHDHLNDSRRVLAVSWCQRLRRNHGSNRVVELGCGFGHLTSALHGCGFASVGIDISRTAVEKARSMHQEATFLQGSLREFAVIAQLDPDIFLMPEITWYVLDGLPAFIKNLRTFAQARERPTFLIHLLTTYPPGVQEYGTEAFTDLPGILQYFDLKYLESGLVQSEQPVFGTYFVARI